MKKNIGITVADAVTLVVENMEAQTIRFRFWLMGWRSVSLYRAAAYALDHGWLPQDVGLHKVTVTREQLLQAFAKVYTLPPWDKEILDSQFALTLCAKLGLDERKTDVSGRPEGCNGIANQRPSHDQNGATSSAGECSQAH